MVRRGGGGTGCGPDFSTVGLLHAQQVNYVRLHSLLGARHCGPSDTRSLGEGLGFISMDRNAAVSRLTQKWHTCLMLFRRFKRETCYGKPRSNTLCMNGGKPPSAEHALRRQMITNCKRLTIRKAFYRHTSNYTAREHEVNQISIARFVSNNNDRFTSKGCGLCDSEKGVTSGDRIYLNSIILIPVPDHQVMTECGIVCRPNSSCLHLMSEY